MRFFHHNNETHLTLAKTRIPDHEDMRIPSDGDMCPAVTMLLAATKQTEKEAGFDQLMAIYRWAE